jgi:pteridine reductase
MPLARTWSFTVIARAEQADALAAQLQSARADSALVVSADLLDMAQLPALVRATCDRFGSLDILVNNASSFYPTPLGTITATQWDDLLGSNLRAPAFLSQAAAPELKRAKGLLLNIVDIHGMRPLRDHVVYSTAKAGLIMLTRALARELAPDVRVNGIAPGPVLWPEGELPEQVKEKILDNTPLHRQGSPQDIARTALFFATAAPFITGQILAVDGGRSIGW